MRLQAFLVAAALALSGSVAAQVPERGTVLAYGITGHNSQTGRRDPGYLLGQAAVQYLVSRAAREPITPEQAERLLMSGDADPDDLVATGILRRTPDGRYALALNYLSASDQVAIRRLASEASRSLAGAFLRRRRAFERLLATYDLPGVDHEAVAMALIGAVVLDWDGLGVTATEGFRLPTVRQATGDQYVPWARERGPHVSVRALYWGSHSADADGIMLTTFGDHHSLPRMAMPDLFWSIGADQLAPHLPLAVRSALLWPARARWDDMQSDAARIMVLLRQGPASQAGLARAMERQPNELRRTIELLESLHYIERGGDSLAATVPIFTEQDRPMIDALRAEGRGIMIAWLRRNFSTIRAELGGLTAIGAGVPFEQLFTEVWHDIFGWTNYRLVQQGLLVDPYGAASRYQGFQPFVWLASLELNAGTRVESAQAP